MFKSNWGFFSLFLKNNHLILVKSVVINFFLFLHIKIGINTSPSRVETRMLSGKSILLPFSSFYKKHFKVGEGYNKMHHIIYIIYRLMTMYMHVYVHVYYKDGKNQSCYIVHAVSVN